MRVNPVPSRYSFSVCDCSYMIAIQAHTLITIKIIAIMWFEFVAATIACVNRMTKRVLIALGLDMS
jgi:hypothetical protein